jgi:hypothetical protein
VSKIKSKVTKKKSGGSAGDGSTPSESPSESHENDEAGPDDDDAEEEEEGHSKEVPSAVPGFVLNCSFVETILDVVDSRLEKLSGVLVDLTLLCCSCSCPPATSMNHRLRRLRLPLQNLKLFQLLLHLKLRKARQNLPGSFPRQSMKLAMVSPSTKLRPLLQRLPLAAISWRSPSLRLLQSPSRVISLSLTLRLFFHQSLQHALLSQRQNWVTLILLPVKILQFPPQVCIFHVL